MAKTLQVRDVPESMHSELRARAASAGVSLSEYVLRVLAEVAGRPAVSDVLRQAADRSGGVTTADVVAAIRAERERRT